MSIHTNIPLYLYKYHDCRNTCLSLTMHLFHRTRNQNHLLAHRNPFYQSGISVRLFDVVRGYGVGGNNKGVPLRGGPRTPMGPAENEGREQYGHYDGAIIWGYIRPNEVISHSGVTENQSGAPPVDPLLTPGHAH